MLKWCTYRDRRSAQVGLSLANPKESNDTFRRIGSIKHIQWCFPTFLHNRQRCIVHFQTIQSWDCIRSTCCRRWDTVSQTKYQSICLNSHTLHELIPCLQVLEQLSRGRDLMSRQRKKLSGNGSWRVRWGAKMLSATTIRLRRFTLFLPCHVMKKVKTANKLIIIRIRRL